MRTATRRWAAGAALALAAPAAACNDYLTVGNTSSVEAGTIDPLKDASTLSNSALQDFAAGYSLSAIYVAWFTGETLPTDTFDDPNNFARRDIPNNAGPLNTIFGSFQRALASSNVVIAALAATPTAGTSVDLARAEMVAGWSLLFLAEQFCTAPVNGGAPLAPAALLDSAATHFGRAITIGRAVTGTNAALGVTLANASLVGRARAYLQAGNRPLALADAQQVPAGFTYNVAYFDDPANRARLGNQFWERTSTRGSISVAPAFRTLNDPRVGVLAPAQHRLAPQDGITPYFVQTKYTSYSSPMRLASRIEADYIAAEASGTAAMLALINARRTANAQGAYAGATDAASVLAEFENQRSREFYLEAKRLGDVRRNPGAVANLPVPGAPFFKPQYDRIGSQTCYPLPAQEVNTNPNVPRS